MLLKISLGLAILVGLVTLYVTHFQVAGNITTEMFLIGYYVTTAQQADSSVIATLKYSNGAFDYWALLVPYLCAGVFPLLVLRYARVNHFSEQPTEAAPHQIATLVGFVVGALVLCFSFTIGAMR